ncbi:MAG: replication initiation factor domain-containing protein [Burkholderiales bacterium]|nr:replication initiation factor domain-containing protein [Burkholderiales bacterium]
MVSLPVCIDYLSFTVPGGDVGAIVLEAQAFLGLSEVEDRGRGMFGYRQSVDLGGYGLIAYGGEAQRGTVLVSINAEGCRRIANFRGVRQWAQSLGARITRLDIAADDHESESVDVARAVKAWRDGLFKVGGRPPKARCIDDFGSGDGRTLYVGSRQSGKLCRVYEKGKQLGNKKSKWTRAEVELHAKDRVIPWDAVTEPVRFLAGSFPYFAFLSLVSERIRTIKRATEISIEAVASWVKLAAGKSINVLLDHFDGDFVELVVAVRREGIPKRLKGWWGAEAHLASASP